MSENADWRALLQAEPAAGDLPEKKRMRFHEAWAAVKLTIGDIQDSRSHESVSVEEFLQIWAAKIVEAAVTLDQEGHSVHLDRLVEGKPKAFLFVVEILRAGAKGNRSQVAEMLNEAMISAHGPAVSDALRHGVFHALEELEWPRRNPQPDFPEQNAAFTEQDSKCNREVAGVSPLLLSIYTNGVSDERILRADSVRHDDSLTVNAKLEKIHQLMPIPPTASAQELALAFGVSKTAVIKTNWWREQRAGRVDNAIESRRQIHKRRAGELDSSRFEDEF